MSSRKNIAITILFVISVSTISTMLSSVLLSKHYSNLQFQMLGSFCQILIGESGVDRNTLMETLKENREKAVLADHENLLERFGYTSDDFTAKSWESGRLIAVICLTAGILIFLFTFLYWHKRECKQILTLTQYLEKVNRGDSELLSAVKDDDYSRLQDEIYKTVTALYQTRDSALAARNNFADNLYNIAHQLKTPITAISLSAQMIKEKNDTEYAAQIQKQVARLTHLEEALLLLSRIDAGTLALKKTNSDVYTVLNLASDHLQELFARSKITVDIEDRGEVAITTDIEWTMEAIMNLLKNCMEHSPAGSTVHCSYEGNPLYVEIRIWDEGKGFEKEDIPHLFERFYRGKNATKEGLGIGLSLAKAIIEMQNGIISAGNSPKGGAFFEIRMYRH